MKKHRIVSLTVNPALDKTTHFKGLVAEQKIRCESTRYDAGGGGINVSKAIARLGGTSFCIFTSGGTTGQTLEVLLTNEKLSFHAIKTKESTRENFIAVDDHTAAQYRFGFSGAFISNEEQETILSNIQELQTDYLVLSGSLNEGLPSHFYQDIAKIAKQKGIKVIVDTSGEALEKVLEEGIYLIKPNVGELAKLIGVSSLEIGEVEDAAQKLIQKGNAEIVVVSLGPQGAVLVTASQTHFIAAPNVVKKSTVGAGDSMVGAMTWALSENKSLKEVAQWGVACGSAATMNEGTQLFLQDDAKRLLAWMQK